MGVLGFVLSFGGAVGIWVLALTDRLTAPLGALSCAVGLLGAVILVRRGW